MKPLKRILIIMSMGILLYSCYDPIEIDTDNLDKVEIPIKLATQLAHGSLILEFDSLIDLDKVGDGMISYENGVAYFKYDTVIDFYKDLRDFLDMPDLDFSNATNFLEKFSLDIDMPDINYNYSDTLVYTASGVQTKIPIDTTFTINPNDTFKTRYDCNSIYIFPSENNAFQLEVYEIGDPIDLNIPYEVYRVDIESGTMNFNFYNSDIKTITDNKMTITPSFQYQYNSASPPISIDTTLGQTISMPISGDIPLLPSGVNMKTIIKIASFKHVHTEESFDSEYLYSRLDTNIAIDLSDYYYDSNDGTGLIEFDVKSYIEIHNPQDTALLPLPDTLNFGVNIENLIYKHVSFNYGIDTAASGNEKIDFDIFNDIQGKIDIEDFRLSNPELKLTMQSNLGFPLLCCVDSLAFTTAEGLDIITNETPAINIPLPSDPMDTSIYIPANRDSIVLDSVSSRLEEIKILNINGLLVTYNAIVNPDDEAGEHGKHNFFYDYNDAVEEDMYDVKLKAQVNIPFEFKFEKITYNETLDFPIDSSSIDSMIHLNDNDSIKLNVKLFTKNFPFDAMTQFYLDKINADEGLYHLDSMFRIPRLLLPSSPDGSWDSTLWTMVIDKNKYENIIETDSLTLKMIFSMDEDKYFQLDEGFTTEIKYKFSIGNSSFVFTHYGEDE